METQNILQTLNLSLLNVDDCCTYNWNFRKVISPFVRIYLVKNGEGDIIHNHKKYELQSGKLYLIPSFSLCNYSSASFLEHYYIHFIPRIIGGTSLFDLLDFEYEVSATEEDTRLMKRILELNPGRKLLNQDPCKYTKANLIPISEPLNSSHQIANYLETQGILLRLFSRFIKIDRDKDTIRNFNPNKQIQKAIDHIHQNLSYPILVSELVLC